jgi:uncharacterized membrane protein YphA (DoxX/SURF4 family)
MSVSRRLGRPLLSAIFVSEGIDAMRNPASRAKPAEAVTGLAERVPGVPNDPEALVRLNGMVQVAAGVLLSIGKFRRLAALALIGSIVPTTYAGHRFWEETDPETRQAQRIHFLKNLGLLGGLILAAVDTEGAPSLGWRMRRKARRTGHGLDEGRKQAAASAQRAANVLSQAASGGAAQAAGAADRARDRGGHIDISKARKQLSEAGAHLADLHPPHLPDLHLGDAARYFQEAAHYFQEGADRLTSAVSTVRGEVKAGTGRAGDLLSRAAEHLPVGAS